MLATGGTSKVDRDGLVVSIPLQFMQTCPECGYSFGVAIVHDNGRLVAELRQVARCPVCCYNIIEQEAQSE